MLALVYAAAALLTMLMLTLAAIAFVALRREPDTTRLRANDLRRNARVRRARRRRLETR